MMRTLLNSTPPIFISVPGSYSLTKRQDEKQHKAAAVQSICPLGDEPFPQTALNHFLPLKPELPLFCPALTKLPLIYPPPPAH